MQEYAVTDTQCVPTMFVRMLKLPEDVRTSYDTSSLKTVVHAAAPCPVAVKQQMLDWLGPVVHEYYASTEANGATYVGPEDWLAHPGTVGRSLLGTPRVCDPSGAELPAGEVGTIYFERDAEPFTYHGDPEKTAATRHPEHPFWATVGDLGYVDDEGYLFLTDRKAFMIISGGVNIYPQEIEDLFSLHPSVLDIAVIGVPDDEMGERVVAFVSPSPDASAGPCGRAHGVRAGAHRALQGAGRVHRHRRPAADADRQAGQAEAQGSICVGGSVMSDLEVRLEEGALWLTLNRPEQFNALTGEMVVEAIQQLREATTRDDVRVVVITGSGGAFSAGADLGGENAHEKYDAGSVDGANLIIRSIIELDKPVVCGLNGIAAGVGMSVALACDLVVATSSAALTLAFTKIGLMPDGGADLHGRGLCRPGPRDAPGAVVRPDLGAGGVRRRPGLARLRRRRLRGRAGQDRPQALHRCAARVRGDEASRERRHASAASRTPSPRSARGSRCCSAPRTSPRA